MIGVPDVEAGELPRAYVVKAADAEITAEEIQAFVAEKVGVFLPFSGLLLLSHSTLAPATRLLLTRSYEEGWSSLAPSQRAQAGRSSEEFLRPG